MNRGYKNRYFLVSTESGAIAGALMGGGIGAVGGSALGYILGGSVIASAYHQPKKRR